VRRSGCVLKGLGCLVLLVLALGLAMAGAALLQSSVEIEEHRPAESRAELEAVLARFAGHGQYVDIVRREDGLIGTHVHHEREPAQPGRITRLHGLLLDEGPGRLVRVSTPGWVLDLARWKTGLTQPLVEPIEQRLGLEVSLPDLAPFGPGLIVDHRGAHGRRIVIWAEGDG
jgi:hypothetical protein